MESEVEIPREGTGDELELLRLRVAQLEDELLEVQARANRAVAEAQERTYWLDRWHLDLNAVMERPGAAEFRAAIRLTRRVYRLALKLRRSLHL